jgi:hypothetical protein
MQVNEQIDWLSITFAESHRLAAILPTALVGSVQRIKSPIPVYKDCYLLPHGAKILMNGGERLGKHLILTGKTLSSMYSENPHTGAELYGIITDFKANVSRMDVAVDVIGSDDFTVDNVRERHLKEQCVTRLRGSKFIGQDRQTETFYIGNIKSKTGKVRIYNKAIEQNDFTEKWVRIEYEKRKNAKAMMRQMFEYKTSIRDIINAVVSFPSWNTWSEIMGETPQAIGRGKEEAETDNRMDWILSSALPAIAAEIVKSANEYETGINNAPATIVINNVLEMLINRQMLTE